MVKLPYGLEWIPGREGKRARVCVSTLEVYGTPISEDTETDGNTVPWIFQWIVPRWSWATYAGLIHDQLPSRTLGDLRWGMVFWQLGKDAGARFIGWRTWAGVTALCAVRAFGIRSLLVKIVGNN